MNWVDLGAAIALLLILEGLFPFLSPDSWKKFVLAMAQEQSKKIRIIGLVMVMLGLALLSIIRA